MAARVGSGLPYMLLVLTEEYQKFFWIRADWNISPLRFPWRGGKHSQSIVCVGSEREMNSFSEALWLLWWFTACHHQLSKSWTLLHTFKVCSCCKMCPELHLHSHKAENRCWKHFSVKLNDLHMIKHIFFFYQAAISGAEKCSSH